MISAATQRIVRNTAWFTFGSIGQKVFSFLYFTIIAMALGVDSTGRYFLALTFTALFATGADWGMSPVITREIAKNRDRGLTLFRAAIRCKGVTILCTATIIAVADASLSTRCGAAGTPIAAAIARSVAAVGLSAVFFQDLFGLITFDEEFRQLDAVRPRIGKPHVIHCLDRYQNATPSEAAGDHADFTATIAAHLRRTSLVPVISDFLFADAARVLSALSRLNAVHDVFLIMVDVRFAYDLPDVSAGWIDVFDVETGRTRTLPRRELRRLAGRIEEWQQDIERLARAADLDIVLVGLDRWDMETALVNFVAERRLRKL